MAQNTNSDRTSDTDEIVPDLLLEYDHRELSTFALVPCSATKNPGRLPAREKYAGALSKKARDYAEAVADGYAILSGKYGALAPYQEVDDYEVSVRDRDPEVWSEEVVNDLLDADPDGWDRLIVLAGAAYREPLQSFFERLGDADVTVEIPLEGLRIGEQMSDLNEALEALEDPREVVTDGGEVEIPDEVNGWSLRLEAGSTVRYEGDLVTVEIFGHQGGFDLKYGSPHTFQTLTLEEGIDDRESAVERLLEVVEDRTPEEAGEHIERLQSDEESDEDASEPGVDASVDDFRPATELEADGGNGADALIDELEIRGRDEDLVERRRDFIREVLGYLRERDSASRSKIMDDLLEDEETSEERVSYAPLSAWKHLVRPSLSSLAEDLDELESPGERGQGGWSWIETVDEPDVDVESLLDQIDALETGDVIRLAGSTPDGDLVETGDLEITTSEPDHLVVKAEVGDKYDRFDVEELQKGVIGTYGRGLSGDEIQPISSIRLVAIAAETDLDEEPPGEAITEEDAEELLETMINEIEEDDVVEVTYRSVANGNDLEVTGEVTAIEGEESPPLYRDVVLDDLDDDRELVVSREDLQISTRGWQGDRKIGDLLGVRVVDDGLDDQDELPEQGELDKSDADKEEAVDVLADMSNGSREKDEVVARAAREIVADELEALVESGLSPSQALDYWFTEVTEGTYGELNQTEWSEIRGTSHQAISDSVRKARKALEED